MEMKHRGGKQNLRPRFDRVKEVLHFAGAAGSDDFRLADFRHRPDDRQIVSGLGAVSRLAGRQNHLNAVTVHTLRPFQSIAARVENRGTLLDVVRRVSEVCTVPFTVGGGISDVKSAELVLRAGANMSRHGMISTGSSIDLLLLSD